MDFLSPIDITKINQKSNEQAVKIGRLVTKSITDSLFYLFPYKNIAKTKDLVTFEEGSLLMPYDPDIIGKGNNVGVFDKRVLVIEIGMLLTKADEPERYRDTWLEALSDLELSPNQLPFATWYLQTLQFIAEQDLDLLPFMGVHSTPSQKPFNICNGYHKIVDNEVVLGTIAAGKGNLFATGGAYTAANIGDLLLDQYNHFPAIVREKLVVDAYIPFDMRSMYKAWLTNKYQYQVADGDPIVNFLDGTNQKCRLNWLSAIGNNQRVMMSLKENMTFGLSTPDIYGKITTFNPNANPYLVQSTKKYPIGFQIASLNSRLFNVNDRPVTYLT